MGDHLLLDKGQHSVTPAESEGANLEESEKQLKKDHSFIPPIFSLEAAKPMRAQAMSTKMEFAPKNPTRRNAPAARI